MSGLYRVLINRAARPYLRSSEIYIYAYLHICIYITYKYVYVYMYDVDTSVSTNYKINLNIGSDITPTVSRPRVVNRQVATRELFFRGLGGASGRVYWLDLALSA